MINNGKATIQEINNRISISIPSKKNWFVLLFGTVWMGGWLFGFLSASSTLFSSGSHGPADAFVAVWLMAWTVGGLGVVSMLLWGYLGKEQFSLDSGTVIFEKTVLGVGLKKLLRSDEIRNIRADTASNPGFGRNRWADWGLGAGKIKFDYGLKTYSFGLAVNDAEANYISTLMKPHFEHSPEGGSSVLH